MRVVSSPGNFEQVAIKYRYCLMHVPVAVIPPPLACEIPCFLASSIWDLVKLQYVLLLLPVCPWVLTVKVQSQQNFASGLTSDDFPPQLEINRLKKSKYLILINSGVQVRIPYPRGNSKLILFSVLSVYGQPFQANPRFHLNHIRQAFKLHKNGIYL